MKKNARYKKKTQLSIIKKTHNLSLIFLIASSRLKTIDQICQPLFEESPQQESHPSTEAV